MLLSWLNCTSRAERLFQLLECFSQARVLVVGDLNLDEFITGQVERISREAPVLILRHETKRVPGGGANAAYNLAKLGAQVKAVGLFGEGRSLRHIFDSAGIDTQGVLIAPDRPTVTKTRISGHAPQSVIQQIVRLDRKSDESPGLDLQLQLAEYIRSQVSMVDAVVCSDYGDGGSYLTSNCSGFVSLPDNCGCSKAASTLSGGNAIYTEFARSRASSGLSNYQSPNHSSEARPPYLDVGSANFDYTW